MILNLEHPSSKEMILRGKHSIMGDTFSNLCYGHILKEIVGIKNYTFVK